MFTKKTIFAYSKKEGLPVQKVPSGFKIVDDKRKSNYLR